MDQLINISVASCVSVPLSTSEDHNYTCVAHYMFVKLEDLLLLNRCLVNHLVTHGNYRKFDLDVKFDSSDLESDMLPLHHKMVC